jgi:hypothetical protein
MLGALTTLVKCAKATSALLEQYHKEVHIYPKEFQNMVSELYGLWGMIELLQTALDSLSASPHFESLLEKGCDHSQT